MKDTAPYGPLGRRVSELKDEKWRIKRIPYESGETPTKRETDWLALPGLAIGIGGGVLLWRTGNPMFAIAVATGFLWMILASALKNKRRKRHWQYVKACCSDKEIQLVGAGTSSRGTPMHTWDFRLICSFEIDGQAFTVTPLYRSSFSSENALQAFLRKTIDTDGTCLLRINPQNPLEAEFVGRNVREL
jgi:hypothetical protein